MLPGGPKDPSTPAWTLATETRALHTRATPSAITSAGTYTLRTGAMDASSSSGSGAL
jgi:hypothetical protein